MESTVINGPCGAGSGRCGAALSLAQHTIRTSKSPMPLNTIAGLLLGQINTAEHVSWRWRCTNTVHKCVCLFIHNIQDNLKCRSHSLLLIPNLKEQHGNLWLRMESHSKYSGVCRARRCRHAGWPVKVVKTQDGTRESAAGYWCPHSSRVPWQSPASSEGYKPEMQVLPAPSSFL